MLLCVHLCLALIVAPPPVLMRTAGGMLVQTSTCQVADDFGLLEGRLQQHSLMTLDACDD